jgi:hypothetical protein
MASPEIKMTSPEAFFHYSDLRQFIRQHIGKDPAPSTLNTWMEAVLDIPPYDPNEPRQYTLEEAMALVLWGRAGELAWRGERKTRTQRRNQLFLEAFEQWQLSQLGEVKTLLPQTCSTSRGMG